MEQGAKPYGFSIPKGLPSDVEISADYEIHIPGFGQDGVSTSKNLWLWASLQGDKKSIRYVYDMNT